MQQETFFSVFQYIVDNLFVELRTQSDRSQMCIRDRHTPIHLGDCFDETELNYILDQTDERIKQIAEEYQSEDIFTQHLSKNNKS